MDSANASSSHPLLEYKLEELDFGLLIGEGRFARVYEGTDITNNRRVAIKRLQRTDPTKYFVAEYEILKKHQHDNLVKIYGYCDEDEEDDIFIILELMRKYKTLEFHLHDNFTAAEEKIVLAWSNRMRIAVGSAKGIEYLHGLVPAVIHRDIKMGNILLDDDFIPKIADFGLSRLIPADKPTYPRRPMERQLI